MGLKKIFLACCLIPQLLFSVIIETDRFSDILLYAEADTLILCDVDNTLIRPTQQVGSVPWRSHIRDKAQKAGFSQEEASDLLDHFWIFVQPLLTIQSVDPETPETLSSLRDKQLPVIGLTNREPLEIKYTSKQLSSAGITLNPTVTDKFFDLPLPFPARYEAGVIHCNENSKADALKLFLKMIGYHPKKVIFIDDRMNHVQDVEKAMSELGIEYVGIRFSKADPIVEAFDPNIADLQWLALPQIVSDTEAQEILYSSNLDD
jgi:FMN phosphatase YigB (HAD superfamily)